MAGKRPNATVMCRLRAQVEDRDGGICAACRVDTATLKPRFNPAWGQTKTALWELDHIKEVSEGGAMHELANLQTLCQACHVEKTKALYPRLAARREAHRKTFTRLACSGIHCAALEGEPMKEQPRRRSFYFSEEETAILEKAAKKAKMTFGEYVKRAALTCALKEIPPTAKRTYEAD